MKIANYEDFEKIVNKKFLNKNIKFMINHNIPFPFSLIQMLNSKYLGNSIESLYLYKVLNNKIFHEVFNHTGKYFSDDDNFYEVEFKILLDYVNKLPKFKELINI